MYERKKVSSLEYTWKFQYSDHTSANFGQAIYHFYLGTYVWSFWEKFLVLLVHSTINVLWDLEKLFSQMKICK